MDGYFDVDGMITQINFHNEYGFNIILNDYIVSEEGDLEVIQEKLSEARQIYYTCCYLMEDVA